MLVFVQMRLFERRLRRENVLKVVSNGERMRRILSGDRHDDLSMHRRNDIEHLMMRILSRHQRVLRNRRTEMKMNVFRFMAILDEKNETIPIVLQFIDVNTVVHWLRLLSGHAHFFTIE